MNARLVLVVLLTSVLALLGCGADQPLNPDQQELDSRTQPRDGVDFTSIARSVVQGAGWEYTPGDEPAGSTLARSHDPLVTVERTVLAGDVAHYRFEVTLGPDRYERIRLHRIVRERRSGCPVRASETLFMLHGGGVGFEGSFLPQASDPADLSLPFYLASNDVDVWGIDLGWVLVPADETDFGFLAGWGLQRDVDDLAAGVSIARAVRLLTGQGVARFHVLSWSAGVIKSYVYAAQQASRPLLFRDVKTLIPVDGNSLLTDDPGSCESVAQLEAAITAGELVDATGSLAVTLAQLATFDPNGFSPLPGLESFTNLQIVLFAQTLTDQFLNGLDTTFHLFAGEFNEFGIPTGLRFVPTTTGVQFYGSWAPYAPLRVELESRQYDCASAADAVAVDFADVTLPVLYVSPGGGFGTLPATTNRMALASSDFRVLEVTTGDPAILDIGHVDVFKAAVAEDLFWAPVLAWIREFSRPGRGGPPVTHSGS